MKKYSDSPHEPAAARDAMILAAITWLLSRLSPAPPQPACVPLAVACLCADCECVVATARDACPVCGSRSLYRLARWVAPVGETARDAEVKILERMLR